MLHARAMYGDELGPYSTICLINLYKMLLIQTV